MAFFVVIFVLLLVAACLLLFIPARWWHCAPGNDRDQLNKAFYQQRIQELQREEAQGVVAEYQAMLSESQQTLLADIPQQRCHQTVHSSSRWVLLPAILVILVVTVSVYLRTGGWQQVLVWQQVQQALPDLQLRVMDPNAPPLSMEEMARMGLGIRTRLQHKPDNVADWLILGRIHLALGNFTSARQSLQRALQLSPDDPDVRLSYARVLTQSDDPDDNHVADILLATLLKDDPHNVQILGLMAFNAFGQQHYLQAVDAWQKMLSLLPPDDGRYGVIKRSVEQAKIALSKKDDSPSR